jgi:hypothetical protein
LYGCLFYFYNVDFKDVGGDTVYYNITCYINAYGTIYLENSLSTVESVTFELVTNSYYGGVFYL